MIKYSFEGSQLGHLNEYLIIRFGSLEVKIISKIIKHSRGNNSVNIILEICISIYSNTLDESFQCNQKSSKLDH